jgi:hypothetical protein
VNFQAEESIGMAMVFTLVSQLQESLHNLVSTRMKWREQEAADVAKREIEARALPVSDTHKSKTPSHCRKKKPARVEHQSPQHRSQNGNGSLATKDCEVLPKKTKRR